MEFSTHACSETRAWSDLVVSIEALGALVSIAFLLAIAISRSRSPSRFFLLRAFSWPFQRFLTFEEANSLVNGDAKDDDASFTSPTVRPSDISFACAALAVGNIWIIAAMDRIYYERHTSPVTLAAPLLLGISWMYIAVRPIAKPISTVPADIALLSLLYLCCSVVELLSALETYVRTDAICWTSVLAVHAVQGLVALALLAFGGSYPLNNVPSNDRYAAVPADAMSLWSFMWYSWVYEKSASESTLALDCTAKPVFDKFSHVEGSTLWRRLFKANRREVLLDAFFNFVGIIAKYGSALAVYYLLRALEHEAADGPASLVNLAAFQFVLLLVKAQADALHLYYSQEAGTRVRQQLMSSVLDHTLTRITPSSGMFVEKRGSRIRKHERTRSKRASASRHSMGTGEQDAEDVNLSQLAADCNRVSLFFSSLFMMVGAPLEIVLGCYLLWRILGRSALIGVAVFLLLSSLAHLVSLRGIRLEQALHVRRSRLIDLVREIGGAIKLLHLTGYKDLFLEREASLHEDEMGAFKKDKRNAALYAFSSSLGPVVLSTLSFFLFTWREREPFPPHAAFTSFILFGMVRGPLSAFPNMFLQSREASRAVSRIGKFVPPTQDELEPAEPATEPVHRLVVKDATFQWNRRNKILSETQPAEPTMDHPRTLALVDVSVTFPPREISIVTGPSGSGKSALLLALLGELEMLPGGTVTVPNDHTHVNMFGLRDAMSYVPQTAWLEHATIKDNILFGHSCHEERYEWVLRACELDEELVDLAGGENFVISSTGPALRAGVAAKIALARAVYSHTGTIILDEPLADGFGSTTRRRIWSKIASRGFLQHRTVIVATKLPDIFGSGLNFTVVMANRRISSQTRTSFEPLTSQQRSATPPLSSRPTNGHIRDRTEDPSTSAEDHANNDGEAAASPPVSHWRTLALYLRESSSLLWFIVAVFAIAIQSLHASEKLWLRLWSSQYESARVLRYGRRERFSTPAQTIFSALPHLPPATEDSSSYAGVYGLIALLIVLLHVLSSTTVSLGSLRASRALLGTVMKQLVHGNTGRPRSVTGRWTSEFAPALAAAEASIGSTLARTFTSFIAAVVSVSLVSALLPQALGLIVLGALLVARIYSRYIGIVKGVRRGESDHRLALFHSVDNVADGMALIRCFGAKPFVLRNLLTKLDRATSTWHEYWTLNRHLLLRLDALAALIVFSVDLLIITGSNSSGTAGVVLTSLLSLPHAIYWTCRGSVDLSLDLDKLGELRANFDCEEPEAEDSSGSETPPAAWPSTSSTSDFVVLDDVKLPPSQSKQHLHDAPYGGISLTFRPRERVALVGRHGSGKSALARAIVGLSRLDEGTVLVDGLNISIISSREIRSRLSFLPSSPAVFSGTLRSNLDPHGEYTDEDIVQCLRESLPPSLRASRTSRFSALLAMGNTEFEELDQPIPAGGKNLTENERYVITLARVLLRQAPIVVWDEVSMEIDSALAAHMQKTLLHGFPNSLVICIASRVRTAMDCDRVIVMERGSVVEDGTPSDLLSNADGQFHAMWIASGLDGTT